MIIEARMVASLTRRQLKYTLLFCIIRYNIKAMISKSLINNLIGNKIKKVREDIKCSQATLAIQIGKSRASLANYESGEQAVPTYLLYLIAEKLSADIFDLLPSMNELVNATSPDRHISKYEEETQREITDFIESLEKEGDDG